jgi:peptidoglycan hydrolase-like protein with peptidoglycan-binding domain/uncharacterized tellurite resistance protein B-like protein
LELAKAGGVGWYTSDKHQHWRYWQRRLALLAGIFVLGFSPAYGQAPQDELRAAQQALQARGYEVGPIDGIMGPLTRAALEAYQRKNAVPVTGTADEPTLQALGLLKVPAQTAASPVSVPASPPAPPASSQPLPGPAKSAPPVSAPQTPARPPAAPATTSQSQGGSNGGLIVFLIVAGIVFFVWRRGRAARLAEEKLAAASSQVSSFQTTVTVSSRSSVPSYGANRYYSSTPPTPDALQKQSSQTWINAGKAVSVAGFTVPDGMVYVGAELIRQDGRGPDNCLINPKLPVADPGGSVPEMSYYPCYSDVSPEARGYYLRWLSSGKRDPAVGIGYVFLYFYGLERRLMLDRVSDEYDALVGEVKRLHELYGKNYSVNRYARQLLEAARLVNPHRKFYEDETPVNQRDYELPLSVRLGVGQLLGEGKTIPWNWMFAWVVNDPETNLRTAASRAATEFRDLFHMRFDQAYPSGFKLNPPKKRLAWSYRAASSSFQVDLAQAVGNLPDIVGLSGPMNKMRFIVDVCMSDLDAYSRFLGRRPDGRGSIQAMALLPPELAHKVDGEDVRKLRAWLDSVLEKGPALVDSGELLSRINGSGNVAYGRTAIRACAEVLAGFDVALMPNPRVSLQLPKAGQPFVLYRYKGGEIPDAELATYRLASLSLLFAVFVAHADGNLSANEQQRSFQLAQAAAKLSDRGRIDLQAHLQWLLAVPPELNALKSRLSALSADDRHQLGQIALSVASADADVRPAEVDALQRIYRVLGLDQDGVLSDLHAKIAESAQNGLVPIRLGDQSTPGFSIPKKPQVAGAATEIRLDPDRLKAISESTQRVNQLLSKVFAEDADPMELAVEKAMVPDKDASEAPPGEPTNEFEGLAPQYRGFLMEILSRLEWQRQELDTLAKSHDLMTDGAVETINEWSFDRFGDALLEDGDPIKVHSQLVSSMTRVAHA